MGNPDMRRGVYVASRASAPERPAMWRNLRAQGHHIISTWIDEAGEGESHDLGDLWDRILREVTSAERLVLYAEAEDFPLKGAYVEVGMALAAGVPVFVVTPGVALDARSLRPLGSWAKHPLVTFCGEVEEALAAPHQPLPAAREEALEGAGALDREMLSEPMDLCIALDFADNPERFDSLRSPADTKEELYRALTTIAAALRAQQPAQGEAEAWKFRHMGHRQIGITMDKREADRFEADGWEIQSLYGHPAPSQQPADDKLAKAVDALEPLARLELPKKPVGNAGAYSILHTDIRRAKEALAALKTEAAS